MRFVVGGLGSIGGHLLKMLESEFDIVVIHHDLEENRQLEEDLDIVTLTGSLLDPEVLKQAGLGPETFFLALTEEDSTNLAACRLARSQFKARFTGALLHGDYFLEESRIFQDLFDISVILSPGSLAVRKALRFLEAPQAFEVLSFGESWRLIGIDMGKLAWVKKTYANLQKVLGGHHKGCRVLILFKEGRLITDPLEIKGQRIHPEDQAFIMVLEPYLKLVMKDLFRQDKVHKNIMVQGGGFLGRTLAKTLENIPYLKVSLIEDQTDKLDQCSGALRRTELIRGDMMEDSYLLEDACFEPVDCIISAYARDYRNVLCSFVLQKYGKDTITFFHSGDFFLKNFLRFDKVVNVSRLAIEFLWQHIQSQILKSVSFLTHHPGYRLAEIRVLKGDILTMPLEELSKHHIIPLGVLQEKIFRPKQKGKLKEGDILLALLHQTSFEVIERIFRPQSP